MNAGQPRIAPSDQKARDRISKDLDASLVVEAGAGTGKTTKLVDRIVSLFASGVTPRNVAAITFTRAAAFELRSRVRKQLELEASPATPVGDPMRAQKIADALRDLDDAAIQTIDSFALGLLRERPIEAGLPPVIETLDEINAGLLFDEKWDEWLSGALGDDAFTAALESAVLLGMTNPLKALQNIAREFHRRWEVFTQDSFEAEPVDRQAASFLRREAATLRLLLPECLDQTDKLYVHITQTALPAVERVLALSDQADIDAALASRTKFKFTHGQRGNWPVTSNGGRPLDDARTALTAMQQAVDGELAALRQSALNTLLGSIARFVTEFARERKKEGRVEFHDALVWARDVLAQDAAARDFFRARYTHVLIDEFQDTDPLQVEIAELLTHDGATDRSKPGALFVVGDPKQSIYRFRRADIGVFLEAVKNTPENEIVRLTNNFRSHPDILKWVNTVFRPWIDENAPPIQAPYVDLDGGVESQFPGQRVRLMGEVVAGANADGVRTIEAKALAALALEVGAGGWKVRGDDGAVRTSEFGDLTVLVRSRTGIELIEQAFEHEGVPFALEGQSLVLQTQEVRDLLNCLAAIDDPTDQVAVVAALRSPAFACDDVALYRWKQAGGQFSYSAGGPAMPDVDEAAGSSTEIPSPSQGEGEGRGRNQSPRRNFDTGSSVSNAFEALGRFNAMRAATPTPELIETFIRERRLREAAFGSANTRDRLTRLNLVVELARQLHDAGRSSLRDFIRWAEDRQSARERMSESPLDQGTPVAVRVMTIHAAKGLEFPIVALAGLRSTHNQHGPVLFGAAGPDAGRVEVRTGPEDARFQTAGYEELSKAEDSAVEAETARLYYVAATRAKDHLFVSVFRSDSAHDKGAIAAKLYDLSVQAKASQPALYEIWSQSGAKPPDAPSAGDAPAYEPQVWQADHDRTVRLGKRRATVTASSIKSGPVGTPHVAEKAESAAREEEPWRKGRAASELGRTVHAVLEDVDLSLAEVSGAAQADVVEKDGPMAAELLRLGKRHARLHGIAEEDAGRVAALAAAVLRSKVMARARAAYSRGRCWREVPVASPLPAGAGDGSPGSPLPSGEGGYPPQAGVEGMNNQADNHPPILEGIIDLIFEDTVGELVIVDYKTDGAAAVSQGASDVDAPGSLELAALPYISQLGAYALAVEQATGHKVTDAVIVFAARALMGLDAEYHLPDLEAAKKDAVQLAHQSISAHQKRT